MHKHRDNVAHPPANVDRQGGGFTAFANTSVTETGEGAAPAKAGARKRGRDIRGLERFRQVTFGEQGFPRLQAMVSRSPAIMYPPAGIEAARARQVSAAAAAAAHVHDDDVDATWAAFEEERRRAEGECLTDGGREAVAADADAVLASSPAVRPLWSDTELATYHHTQLDTFIKLLYEFNHLTYVKLPMADTLQLLGRCGKEAVAHVMEHEMHVRAEREGRIRGLRQWHTQEQALQRRRTDVEAQQAQRLLDEAEAEQRALEAEMDDARDDKAEVTEGEAELTGAVTTTNAVSVAPSLEDLE